MRHSYCGLPTPDRSHNRIGMRALSPAGLDLDRVPSPVGTRRSSDALGPSYRCWRGESHGCTGRELSGPDVCPDDHLVRTQANQCRGIEPRRELLR